MQVAVIGGGAIGLCSARSLAERGHDVILVERGVCGSGASYGNAGWIAPVLSGPMPAPGVVRQGLLWLARPNSPFRIRPGLDPHLALWLWRFWRSSTRERYLVGLRAMVALAEGTFIHFDRLERELGFEMHRRGLTLVVRDKEHLNEYLRLVADATDAGYPATVSVYHQPELAEFEPALLSSVASALHIAEERYVRPDDFTSQLVADLRARRCEMLEGTLVERLVLRDDRVTGLETSAGRIHAEAVVISAGAWSAELVDRLGFGLPLLSAKGFGVTAALPPLPPKRPLYLAEARVGVSPFDQAVRFAGTLELGSSNLRANGKRIDALRQAAALYLRPEALIRDGEPWAGLRPLLPDGLPAIGPIPGWRNAFVATGHGTLGITLSPVTGELIADVVTSGHLPEHLVSLDPRRFSRYRHSRKEARWERRRSSSKGSQRHVLSTRR